MPACSAESPPGATDAGVDASAGDAPATPDASGMPCTSAASCDDGLYCNGDETCTAGHCAAGTAPACADTIACTVDRCVETTRACEHRAPDTDGDGFGDASCIDGSGVALGDDCDDHDPLRYPGRMETCDAMHDEDCNLATFGFLDADGDGHASHLCCNAGGACGDDCNDGVNSTHPGASEVCNGLDDDCDETIDDIIDGMVFCAAGDMQACTTMPGGLSGQQTCGPDCRSWNPCRAAEVCNGIDDDGNGSTDEGFPCVLNQLSPCTTSCGTSGFRSCDAGCVLGTCHASEVCNFCDDDGTMGITDEHGLATSTDNARLLEPDSGVTPTVDTHVAGAAAIMNVPGGGGADYWVRLLDGGALPQVGAYWIDLNRYQGWGPTTITAELQVHSTDSGQAMGGWAVVVATGGTGDVGMAQDEGVPTSRTGARFDWFWGLRNPNGPAPDTTDRVGYAQLPMSWRGPISAGGTSIAEHGRPVPTSVFSAGSTSVVTQTMIIVYQPEDPTTTTVEERVTIAYPATASSSCTPGSTCPTLGMECITTATGVSPVSQCMTAQTYTADIDGNTVDPNDDIPVGSRLSIGITAGTYAFTFRPPGAPMDITYQAHVVADLYLHHWQPPPAGSGLSPITTPHSAIRRAGTCAGF